MIKYFSSKFQFKGIYTHKFNGQIGIITSKLDPLWYLLFFLYLKLFGTCRK